MLSVVDKRDLRDPEVLGIVIENIRDQVGASYPPLSVLLDGYTGDLSKVPNYDGSETMGSVAVRQYQAELRARAARGDRYAISVLETGEPGDTAE